MPSDPLVRLLRGGQVTLPAEVRQRLKLARGDYLEALVEQDGVLLKPVSVSDRAAALDELMEIVNKPKWCGPGPEPSEDELMRMVIEEIHAMRRENDKGGS